MNMRRVVKTKCRIKRYSIYSITLTNIAPVYIECKPQQIWGYVKFDDKVDLIRDNVSMYISMSDFEENWEVVDDGKNE